jgi:hypothetical protein
MIQISYEPAFDALHAAFRAARLQQALLPPGSRIPVDHFRILDFYLVFPDRFQDVRLRPEHRALKTQAKAVVRAAPYGPRPDDLTLFERMKPFQISGLDTLAGGRLLSVGALNDGWVEAAQDASAYQAAEPLLSRARELNSAEAGLLSSLSALMASYRLEGPDGLKHRTGLMEHRYDAV